MKVKILFLFVISFCLTNAQQKFGITGDTNWLTGWTNFKPKNIEYRDPTIMLVEDIKVNTTLSKSNTYLLKGTVHVINNAVLTIEPGTVIRGDFDTNGTLTITKGSKIMAVGLETEPIIFTSNKNTADRKPGDWGGVILMGDAPINRPGGKTASFYEKNPLYSSFGGNNDDSDSGIMKYVRIEFAGKKIDPKISLNGLTLAGVGQKTKIEYVQVSYCSDDAYEIVGGNVDLNNLISYRSSDDDFDFSMGVQSVLSNSLAVRNPYFCDNTRSRCIEIDSYDNPENCDFSKKKTYIKINNVSLINDEDNNLGLVKEAISIKYDSFIEINNCLVVGFSSFIAFDDKYLTKDFFKKVIVNNTKIDSCKQLFTNELLNKNDDAQTWFLASDKTISLSNVGINNLFKNFENKKRLDFRLK